MIQSRLRLEGDGWVDWSGLATLLANLDRVLLEAAHRLNIATT
jgi:hypothetical protein